MTVENISQFENRCLTIEQANELQALGIDFKNSILSFNEIPTLTNSEMLEMLPDSIDYVSKYKYLCVPGFENELPYEKRHPLKYYINIDKTEGGKWRIRYSIYGYEGVEESLPHSTEPDKDGE
jgi:hypothetical protein